MSEPIIEDENPSTRGGPPGWLAFAIVAGLVLSTMMVVVLLAVLSGFGKW